MVIQLKLMTSWAVVCDVYFLEPQVKRPDEKSSEFADRLQQIIADKAKLKIAPWDGYLKYYNLAAKVGHCHCNQLSLPCMSKPSAIPTHPDHNKLILSLMRRGTNAGLCWHVCDDEQADFQSCVNLLQVVTFDMSLAAALQQSSGSAGKAVTLSAFMRDRLHLKSA